jgi:hypothetical protein
MASVDGKGRAFLVWDQSISLEFDEVVVAEETPSGFTTHEPGAALSGLGTLPVIAAGEAGDVVVAWRQSTSGDTGDIHVSERSPEGVWRDPKGPEDRFSFGEKAYEPRLATRPAGETILVWNQWYAGVHYGVALATRETPTSSWVGPAGEEDVLSQPSYFSNAPQIAVNSRGDALSTWYQSAGNELVVFRSERFGAEGTFSRPKLDDYVSATGAPIDGDPVANPKPAVAEDGQAAIAWTQETGKGGVAVYLASRNAERSWTKPSSLADSLSRQDVTCRDVRVGFGPRGELYVLWSEDAGAGPVVVLAVRGADGLWIAPGQTPIVMSSGDAAEAISPVLAVSRSGAVLAAWSEQVGGFFRAAVRRGEGAAFGPIEQLSPAGEHALLPSLAIGGPRERAVVAWLAGDPSASRVRIATTP